MRYQQLENQEARWKWLYLLRKIRQGENVTRYEEVSFASVITQELLNAENSPQQINQWITEHLAPELTQKLGQALRAKRKRFFNAEQLHTRKKSIDLDYQVWKRLATFAQKRNLTLSQSLLLMMDTLEQKK